MQDTLRVVYSLLLVIVLLTLGSCGSGSSGTQPPPPPPAYSFAYLNHVDTNLYQIKTMKTDGTSQLPVGAPDNFTYVRLSPDGKKVVFSYLDSSNVSQVGLINTDGSGRTNLTLPPADNYPQYPQFTPDGTKIIYQSLTHNAYVDIVMVNLDGSNPTYLTNGGGNHLWPTVSPDGKLVALGVDSPTPFQLATMNIDGSDLKVIGPDARVPVFSADGKKIFFNSSPGDTLYSINADGSNLTQLTRFNYDNCPLVRGNNVLFQSSSSQFFLDGYQIFKMAEDGSHMTQLTHDAVFDGFCL
jgi:TolB protein